MSASVETYLEIREAVAKLCARFPGRYWRALDREMAYPTGFVSALTEAGWLSILSPEEYGGSGLPLSGASSVKRVCIKSPRYRPTLSCPIWPSMCLACPAAIEARP